MALVVIPSSDQKSGGRSSFRVGGDSHVKMPWAQLKDYLRDDLSSSSSSGFRSFPRRSGGVQCCGAASRGLIRLDSSSKRLLCRKQRSQAPKPHTSSPKSKISSALRRASVAVINAVKLLPLKSSASDIHDDDICSRKKKKPSILPRSFSRRLFSSKRIMSFVRSSKPSVESSDGDEEERSGSGGRGRSSEIERWIWNGIAATDAAAADKYAASSDLSNTTATTTTTTSSDSAANSSDSWSDSDSECGIYSRRTKLDGNGVVFESVGKQQGITTTTTGGDEPSFETTTEENEEETKEKLSPVSVINFPDSDGEEEKPPTRRRRRRSLRCLHPVNLESMLSVVVEQEDADQLTDDNDEEEYSISPKQLSSVGSPIQYSLVDQDHDSSPSPAPKERLVEMVMAYSPSNGWDSFADVQLQLLLDFFEEGMMISSTRITRLQLEQSILKEAEDWLSGSLSVAAVYSPEGWKVNSKKREAYVQGEWWCCRNVVDQDIKEDIGLCLEGELLDSMLDELFQDML